MGLPEGVVHGRLVDESILKLDQARETSQRLKTSSTENTVLRWVSAGGLTLSLAH